jgi:hypothetical protein
MSEGRRHADPSSVGVMASSGFLVSWRYRNIEAPPAAATPAPVSTDDDHDDFSLAAELDDEAARCEIYWSASLCRARTRLG